MKKTWHAGFFKAMMKSIETLLKKKHWKTNLHILTEQLSW